MYMYILTGIRVLVLLLAAPAPCFMHHSVALVIPLIGSLRDGYVKPTSLTVNFLFTGFEGSAGRFLCNELTT